MAGNKTIEIRYEISQRLSSARTVLARGYYKEGDFKLSNIVIDKNNLKIYVNGELWKSLIVSPITFNRIDIIGGDRKVFIDELLILPEAVSESTIKRWVRAEGPFVDVAEMNFMASQIEQTANMIALRVDGSELKTPTGITIGNVDGQGKISLQGNAVKILSDNFTLDNTGLEVFDGEESRTKYGNISGKPWGDGVLPPNTYGLWGDRAGLYLRGYPRIVAFGNIPDEGVLELPPDVTGTPIMQLSLSQIVVPEIGTTILANYTYNPEVRSFKTHAKIIALSPPRTLPGIGGLGDSRNGYTHTVPKTADEDGIYGRKMNTVTIKAGFGAPSGAICRLEVYTNCEFDGDGKPVASAWKLQHTFLYERGLGAGYSGYWPLLTLNLPQVYGEDTRYALRFIDKSKVGFYTSATWVESIEYRENTFYDIEGAEIGPTDPSGIELSYIVFEQG